MSKEDALISLEQARALVAKLEQDDVAGANELLHEISKPINQHLFEEVGKLTRELHSSLQDFSFDHRIVELASQEIPDATERLNYVMSVTEQAANRTMDAVEAGLPLADAMQSRLKALQPGWQQLMQKELPLDDFKGLCRDVDALMVHADGDMGELRNLLNEVLMAQDYQDLTGQVIRRVINLVREVESSLVEMLTMFGHQQPGEKEQAKQGATGPAATVQEQQDAVTTQDEVDDLLSSLGF